MAQTKIDGLLFKEMFQSGAALLTQNRESVDALNVFPVPDGDTGTNMSQTINSAVKEMQAKNAVSVGDVAAAIARGALKGARGNSGVILSQILRGFASALDGAEDIDCALMIRALRAGADTAYKAVMKPKEGTILTVARVMAEDAERNLREMTDIVELFRAILKSGEAILKKTPDMLPVLKQAGVVDSGGTGLTIIYRGMLAAPHRRAGGGGRAHRGRARRHARRVRGRPRKPGRDYIWLLHGIHRFPPAPGNARQRRGAPAQAPRAPGDCVLVISDLSVVKVHVHTNDPGKALQYALELGELDAIKIDNMFEEHRERMAKLAAEEAARQKPYGIVCVALGKGLSDIFTELNVDQIVDGGQTMNPSIEDLFEAIEKTHAQNVFVLPNNTNIILAAQQAAELTERNVVVLPTKSVPMGISAALAFDPEKGVEENRAAMTEAAENVHTASITYAVRDTNFDGHDIHAGDIMGLIDNKLHELGHDVREVAERLTEEMVTEDKSLITIYYGEDVTEEDAQTLLQALAEKYDQCDVDLQNGGQPLYYYLIAVE